MKVVIKIENEYTFKCTVVNQRYYSEDSSFGVFVFHTKDDIPETKTVKSDCFNEVEDGTTMSTLAGVMQQLYIGSEYEVTASLEYNQKYNSWQYKPKSITALTPKTQQQQHAFLRSIITERQSESLLAAYPNIVSEIVEGKDNVDFSKTKYIKQRTYDYIKEKVLNNYVISEVLAMLQPLGVSYNKIKKLISEEPNPTLLKRKLLENPYIMMRIKGFGFKTVDQLALQINPDLRVSDKRTYAFVKSFLTSLGENQGHTWVTFDVLESGVRDNINECIDKFHDMVEKERRSEILLHFDGDRVGLKRYWEYEINTLDILKTLDKFDALKVSDEEIEKGISKSEKDQGFKLTEEQREAVIKSTKSNVVITTGKSGSGKTSISRAVLNIYKEAGYSISCCALSAMAAQRITEATGFKASTIHRLLGYGPHGFEYNHYNPLNSDVILVDECSMINVDIFNALVSATKEGSKIIMCGDRRQLPPIGYGNIFGDLLDMDGEFNTNRLTKVLRQAAKSGILMDANKIVDGIYPIDKPELRIVNGELKDMYYMFRDNREQLQNIAINTYMGAIKKDGLDNVVIVVPRRAKCTNSAEEINKKIVDLIADKTKASIKYGEKVFYIGAKVMQIENDYEKNVFNGEIGYITDIYIEDIEAKEKQLMFNVEYKMNGESKVIKYKRNEIDQIDLAYASTCHKLQGGGYKTVIVIIDMTHYTLLDTCMLYTAITRSKKRCLLLAEPMAFKMCMENNKSKERQTWLSLMK